MLRRGCVLPFLPQMGCGKTSNLPQTENLLLLVTTRSAPLPQVSKAEPRTTTSKRSDLRCRLEPQPWGKSGEREGIIIVNQRCAHYGGLGNSIQYNRDLHIPTHKLLVLINQIYTLYTPCNTPSDGTKPAYSLNT